MIQKQNWEVAVSRSAIKQGASLLFIPANILIDSPEISPKGTKTSKKVVKGASGLIIKIVRLSYDPQKYTLPSKAMYAITSARTHA
jgi:hypothetical protein